jgi:hypothetical protein
MLPDPDQHSGLAGTDPDMNARQDRPSLTSKSIQLLQILSIYISKVKLKMF